MGLTKSSTGAAAVDCFAYDAQEDEGTRIALAGNPNVGKSTVFNELTGMHQHTGNWPGKTVTGAKGECTYKDTKFTFVDLPGLLFADGTFCRRGGCAGFYMFWRA